MTVTSPIGEVKGVGEALQQKFHYLGVKTVADLIDYYPRRYEDYSIITPIKGLNPGPVTIEATIKQAKGRRVRRGLHITEAVASDASGSVRIVWFNQPYRAASLKAGQTYFISGQFELSRQHFVLMNPSVEKTSDLPINAGRILAVYRETKGITSRQIRSVVSEVRSVIEGAEETLPPSIIKDHKLMSRAQALLNLHMPVSGEALEAARRRLGFEEVFQLTLASLMNKQEVAREDSLVIDFQQDLALKFVKNLEFKLTDSQRRAVWQIYQDIQLKHPMNRLVEGDVGSGKTVVAAMAALMAMAQGWQVALMAPTELLVAQHAETIHGLMRPLGFDSDVVVLTGSMTAAQKKNAHKAIAEGKAKFIIGTHALIQEKVDMKKLALIIIDEQHRFGVEQRKTLMAKAGHMPHVLSLTATPIPRSLALTLYGEMDISIIAEKPVGRKPIKTRIIAPAERARLYKLIDEQLAAGHQMFVVCPLITESGALDANSAEKTYEELKTKIFKNRRVGLLHGKLKSDDKHSVMQEFVDHKLDILVSTTVIEVGVDVPNANIMMIESAERFGLAQLHQLRGRIGRGDQQGHCYLMLSDSQAPTKRMRALTSSNDGFELAELDLEIRGPGAIYGTSQHGQLDLRIAKLTDTKLIAEARSAAQKTLDQDENLLQYKHLMSNVNRLRAVTNLN